MKWKVLAATAATLLVLYLVHSDGYDRGKLKGDLKVSSLESALATARADAASLTLEKQRQLDAETNRMTNEHSQAMAELQRTAADDRAESDGLRSELAKLQGRLRQQQSDPTSTGFKLAPGIKASMVLSELLASCSSERSELAIYSDKAYARGRALEALYDKVRGQ